MNIRGGLLPREGLHRLLAAAAPAPAIFDRVASSLSVMFSTWRGEAD